MSTDFTNWQIFQSNEDTLFIQSTLEGDKLTGTGFGSFADFKISWDDGSVGSYLGMLDHDIRLVVITFSVHDPVTQATWVSS